MRRIAASSAAKLHCAGSSIHCGSHDQGHCMPLVHALAIVTACCLAGSCIAPHQVSSPDRANPAVRLDRMLVDSCRRPGRASHSSSGRHSPDHRGRERCSCRSHHRLCGVLGGGGHGHCGRWSRGCLRGWGQDGQARRCVPWGPLLQLIESPEPSIWKYGLRPGP